MPLRPFYTVAEAAELCRLSRKALQKRAERGQIRSKRVGGRRVLNPFDVEALVNNGWEGDPVPGARDRAALEV